MFSKGLLVPDLTSPSSQNFALQFKTHQSLSLPLSKMNLVLHEKTFSPPIQLPLPFLPPPPAPPASPPPPPASPPPPPPTTFENILQNKLSPSMLLLIIVLAIIFFISGLLHLLVRYFLKPINRNRDDSEMNDVTAMQGQLQQLFHLHDSGVDQSFIDTLPVFLYKDIIGLKDPFDCAVCLCEFEGDDKLRLLPKCSHAFHVECIDTWLLSHSTCPLCRRSLLSDQFSPNNSHRPMVYVLESASESSREIASERGEHGSNSNMGSLVESEFRLCDDENSQKQEEIGRKEDTKVVTVKLGKFKSIEGCIEEGEGTSNGNSNTNTNASNNNMSNRRCLSMGSFEYVMDERSSLCVAIKPPKQKPTTRKPARRLAMSECDCYSRREGFKGLDPSRLSVAKSDYNGNSSFSISANLNKKDSFSVSKIWMISKKDKDQSKHVSDDLKRKALSFRLPLHRPAGSSTSPVKLLECNVSGLDNKSGSEMDWDVELGSCNNGGSSVSSVVGETPSFAKRTLLWVMGRQNKTDDRL